MTKRYLPAVFLGLMFFFFDAEGQTPDWVWARSAPSATNGYGEGWSIAVDNFDNVFITGFFYDTIFFSPYVLSVNHYAAYIAKYDSNGNVKWAKNSTNNNGSSYIQPNCVCTDKSGNSYLTGFFRGNISFGAFTLTTLGADSNIFLVKYDSIGTVLWAKSEGGTSRDVAMSVATDVWGNLYVTGYFNSPNISFGSYTLSNVGSYDIFLAKYDSTGSVLWAKSAGGSLSDIGLGVATEPSGNVYITGYFMSPNAAFGGYTLSSAGGDDIFIVKFDSSGNELWVRGVGGSSADIGLSIAADSLGNPYLTGSSISPSLSFGSHSIINSGNTDVFIAKYDSSGNSIWAKGISGDSSNIGISCVACNNSMVYISGSFNFSTNNSITFDTIILARPNGSYDPMFIACYDSSGHAQWAKALVCGGDDNNAVAVGPSGCIYIGSDFGVVVNPFIVGYDSLYRTGSSENVFVAKLCNIGLSANFISSDTIFCNETTNCINFFDHSTGNPTSWQWHFTGATPDTSSLQNPTNVCYNTPGTYPVSLIVSDGTSYDTLTVSPLIIFGTAPAVPNVTVGTGDTLFSSHGFSYQWFLNGNAIGGATDSFYLAHQNGTYAVQVSDSTGSCHSISNGVSVGVKELSEEDGWSIYPNPVDKKFTVYGLRFTAGALLQVYNVLGKRVLALQPETVNSKPETTIDVSQLPAGVYFIIFSDGKRLLTGKFVKM